jgi:glycosyltransferase involved in cell wall biosynthesis
MDDFETRLEEAERLFCEGRPHDARDAFAALAHEVASDRLRLSRVLNDLGVVTAALDGGKHARPFLARAVRANPANADALENLAAMCRDDGDTMQAVHWLRRAVIADPASATARDALVAALEAAHEWEQADAIARGAGDGAAARRLLVLTHVFHPSVGGTEVLSEQAAVALRDRGWEVEVGTSPMSARTVYEHRGIPIHELADDGGASLRALVEARRFSAILAFSGPLLWPILTPPALPQPRPRVVLVPCVNPDTYRWVTADAGVRAQYTGLVRQADVLVYSSEHGWDARLVRELGLRGTCVPNAAARLTPGRDPAARGGARLLCVGNLWNEKNHVGLLETLQGDPGDWSLRIIGGPPPPGEPSPEPTLRALADADPRVTLSGPAPASEVAAAMREADILLLPSKVEATPMVLVEAMAHGLPWIATPTCGSAADHAGGLIAPLRSFPDAIRFLLADDDARRALGAAGAEHYEAAYTWSVVAARFDALLSGADHLARTPTPPAAAEQTAAARARYYEALIEAAAAPLAVA